MHKDNFLTHTKKDVMVLIDNKIIINWMSDANILARMINHLSSDVPMSFQFTLFLSME